MCAHRQKQRDTPLDTREESSYPVHSGEMCWGKHYYSPVDKGEEEREKKSGFNVFCWKLSLFFFFTFLSCLNSGIVQSSLNHSDVLSRLGGTLCPGLSWWKWSVFRAFWGASGVLKSQNTTNKIIFLWSGVTVFSVYRRLLPESIIYILEQYRELWGHYQGSMYLAPSWAITQLEKIYCERSSARGGREKTRTRTDTSEISLPSFISSLCTVEISAVKSIVGLFSIRIQPQAESDLCMLLRRCSRRPSCECIKPENHSMLQVSSWDGFYITVT